MPMNDGSYMKKKAKSALAPWRDKEEEEKDYVPKPAFRAAPDNEDDGGTDEPADVHGLAKKKEKEKDSGWGKKVVAAIAGIGGAVAGLTEILKVAQPKK
jgi:hypothetical protein